MAKSLVQLTPEIIQAQASRKGMTADEVNTAFTETFKALKELHGTQSESPAGFQPEPASQAVDAGKSIQKNKIVCLECRQEFKMLSGKHLATHALNAKAYRAKYGIPARQPLCAKAVSERRSLASKERGLPENLRKSIEARKKKVTEE